MKERQLQAVMGDLRRSGGNMGFLRKRAFDHFSRFGIEGLLSVSSILISVLLLRVLIILHYVNFLAISRLLFPAIRGDFPERYLDEHRKSKSEIRILRFQILIKNQLPIENQISIIEMRRSEMRRIEKPKIQNRVIGVPSPHLTSPAMKTSQVFRHLFFDYHPQLLYDYRDNYDNQEISQANSM